MRYTRGIAVGWVIGMVTVPAALRAQTPASPRAPLTRTVKADDRTDEAFKALYSGDPGRALRLSSEYLKQHPSDARALVLQARAHLARQEYQEAYDSLVKALAADDRNADALYFLGIVAAQLSTGAFDRMFALQPGGARVHQLMARSLKLQDSPVEAAAEYELALKVDPNLVDVLLEFAGMDREQSNCEHAVGLYERAQRVQPSYDGAYGLGVCLALLNDHPRAIDAFRDALKHDPRSAAAEFGLGSSLLQLGDAAAAVAALQRAAQLAPNMRETYYVLGRAYQKMGQAERAQEAFARATALARSGATGVKGPIR
ncbi:MAG TPA: tetratricopeptide repeat protein [Vicinamibacterales bacterium]